jgi:hypothetical protein
MDDDMEAYLKHVIDERGEEIARLKAKLAKGKARIEKVRSMAATRAMQSALDKLADFMEDDREQDETD